jgi:hypothetical protein
MTSKNVYTSVSARNTGNKGQRSEKSEQWQAAAVLGNPDSLALKGLDISAPGIARWNRRTRASRRVGIAQNGWLPEAAPAP